MAPGKVLGAMLGLAIGMLIGGPLPIVLLIIVGIFLGHQVDELHLLPSESAGEGEPLSRSVLNTAAQDHFARHLCALFIEVARADGDVVRDEVRVVREYFADELKYGPEALGLVRRYLKEHLARPPSLEDSAAACREELPTAERLLLLDALYTLALVDGSLHRAEQDTLRRVSQGLGLSEEDFRSVTARHFGDGDVHYSRLGLTPEASDADIKKAYRQLAAAHHPDRVAHLGQGAVQQASRRFQEIKEAYEELRRLRGL
ncbi:TerB family tellurite resistance protein [Archangium lipolyticum]|uniref:TerB family tellurite resistance protein n=1 Tax=Archangium lipolyticum TaxID=2970465 RepID=UPI00214A4445|nr:TerB family tellurite resistance protein [Archangium lipolyticum]